MFKRASKQQTRVRMAITGSTGSGKTYTALLLASLLGEKIAVIDTEYGSASLYSDEFTFDVCELRDFSPKSYVRAIKAAVQAGYDVCVVDSLTHEWNGAGGVLEIAGGKFTGWKDATPAHNELISTMVSMRGQMHIIATMRSKMDYVYDETNPDRSKRVQRLGLAPIQREETPYEFDIVGDLDHTHTMSFSKTRCKALDGKIFRQPGEELATIIKAWLSDGAPVDRKQKMIDKIAALWAQERELAGKFTEGHEAALASVLKSQREESAQDLAALSEEELTAIGLSVRTRVEELDNQLAKREEEAAPAV